MSDLNPYEEGLALELQAAQKRIEALTEQLAAARKDAEEAEVYAEELEAKLKKALPAVTPAPDAAAATLPALLEAAEARPNHAYRVGYAAGRAAGLREAAAIVGEMVEGALTVQAQEHAIQCQEAILALLPKGGA